MIPNQEDEEDVPQRHTISENAYQSVYHALAFTTIVGILYYYKRFMRRNAETHIAQVIVLIAIASSIIFFCLRVYVPNFYKSTINGVGWGIGMTLMKHVLVD